MAVYDRLIFGMKCLNVSQIGSAYDGKNHYSHVSYEVDLAGMDTGADVWRNKMPNTYWYCAGAFGNANTGNTRFFWSCDKNGKAKKVLCADGYLRYITLALTHSNRNFSVGHYYKLDEIMYQEGTSGKATGNHIHLEICAGHVRTKYRNRVGGYNLANMLPANKMMFLLNGYSYIKNGGGLSWKTTSTVPWTDGASNGTYVTKPTNWNRKLAKGKAYTVIPKQGLNLRKGNSTKAPVIKTEPCGTKLYYYGGYAYNGKEAWVWVTDGKNEGFVKGDARYLEGYIA